MNFLTHWSAGDIHFVGYAREPIECRRRWTANIDDEMRSLGSSSALQLEYVPWNPSQRTLFGTSYTTSYGVHIVLSSAASEALKAAASEHASGAVTNFRTRP